MATGKPSGKAAQARNSGQARQAGTSARTGSQRGNGQRASTGARQGGRTRANDSTRTETPLAGGGRSGGTARTSGGTKSRDGRASTGQRDEAAAEAAGAPPIPLWRSAAAYPRAHKLEFTTLVASLLGLAASIYLTIDHFTNATSLAGCPENATINCLKVTTSPQSHIFGIPVAVLGLAFFVFMVPINSPWGWRAKWPLVHWARLASVVVGMALVLYLIYAELFLIDAICLYCTFVHLMTFILFALIVARVTFSGVTPAPDRR